MYEYENYDYPTQIQESLSEFSSTIGYNITSFAATNLKGTNLPVPAAPAERPVSPHKTLPHALLRASSSAAGAIRTAASAGAEDRLGLAFAQYGQAWERIAAARLDQDAHIQDHFLHPWQTTLNTSIAVAMKARQAVKASRLELDAAKQQWVFLCVALRACVLMVVRLKNAGPARQEQARIEVENAEDDLVQKTEVAITLMKTVLENVSWIVGLEGMFLRVAA